MSEYDSVEELTEEELEETTGGAGGYGNVQYVCSCNKSITYITEKKWAKHLLSNGKTCKQATVYYQKEQGKITSNANKAGIAKVTYGTNKLTIKYPEKGTSKSYTYEELK